MNADSSLKNVPWYYRRPSVILILAALGPFGLYQLWKSPAFTTPSKTALTVLVIVLTVYLVIVSFDIYRLMIERLRLLYEVMS